MTSLLSAARVLASPPSGARGPERRRYDPDLTVLALALMAGALALVAGWLLLEGSSDRPGSAEPMAATILQEPAPPAADAELPREWRWQRDAVDFDGMYRTQRNEEPASRPPWWLPPETRTPDAP